MCNRKLLTVALLPFLLLAACHKKTATAPVPGAINTFDSTTYRALSDAQAAINSFKADLAAGKLTETPAIKTALNQVIADYNSANALYQAYHASGGGTATAPIAAATTQLQTDVNNLAATGGTK